MLMCQSVYEGQPVLIYCEYYYQPFSLHHGCAHTHEIDSA
jgi:hypothetical protein